MSIPPWGSLLIGRNRSIGHTPGPFLECSDAMLLRSKGSWLIGVIFIGDICLRLLYYIFFIASMVGIWSPYNFGDLMMSGFQQLLVSPLWAWVKFDEALDTLDSTSDLRLQPGSTICSCLYPNWGSFRQLYNVCYAFWALHNGWWRLGFKHKLCDW